jgi:hypothetical protein
MKITIITPCSRPENLKEIFLSINFNYVETWIIVYDTTKDRKYTKQFSDHSQILEKECSDPGISGNPQRNHALRLVKEGFIYFLDDDNIIHPEFWSVLPTLDENYFYTWDQERGEQNIAGNTIEYKQIDTAMFIVPKKICKNLKWSTELYHADYTFIQTIYNHNLAKHKYIPKILCYYNKIQAN